MTQRKLRLLWIAPLPVPAAAPRQHFHHKKATSGPRTRMEFPLGQRVVVAAHPPRGPRSGSAAISQSDRVALCGRGLDQLDAAG